MTDKWKEKLRTKFEGKNVPLNSIHPMMIDSLIVFIDRTRQEAIEEKIEKIKEMKYAEPMGDERQGGFNSACDDIINLLESTPQ